MEKPIKVLLVEDEELARNRLRKMIHEHWPSNSSPCEIVGEAESVVEALTILNRTEVDLAFFDIQLADGLSFEILERHPMQAPIIFTTAYNQYAIEAFKHHSIHYLLKPIAAEDMKAAIEKYFELYDRRQTPTLPTEWIPELSNKLEQIVGEGKKQYKKRFLIKVGDKYSSLGVEQVQYLYTEEKMVFAVTEDQKRWPVDHSLEELEELLDPEVFFRLNRQVISKAEAIQKLVSSFNGKMKVVLQPTLPNTEVMVSRDKASLLKQWLDT